MYGPIKNGLCISFLGTKITEANKLLKTDAKTVLYRTILCVRAATPMNYAKEKIKAHDSFFLLDIYKY